MCIFFELQHFLNLYQWKITRLLEILVSIALIKDNFLKIIYIYLLLKLNNLIYMYLIDIKNSMKIFICWHSFFIPTIKVIIVLLLIKINLNYKYLNII